MILPNKVKTEIHLKSPVYRSSFDYSGEYILCTNDSAINLYNSSLNLVQEYRGHSFEVRDFSIFPGNSQFVSVGGDKFVFLWDTSKSKIITRFKGHLQKISCCEILGDLVFTGSDDTTLKIWDLRSRKSIQSLEDASDAISDVKIKENTIFTASIDGKVRTYDIRAGTLWVDDFHVPLISLSLGKGCYVVSELKSEIALVDSESGKLLQKFQGHKNGKYKIENLLLKDSTVLSGSENGQIIYWNILDSNANVLGTHNSAVISLCYSTDRLLTGSTDGTLKLWL